MRKSISPLVASTAPSPETERNEKMRAVLDDVDAMAALIRAHRIEQIQHEVAWKASAGWSRRYALSLTGDAETRFWSPLGYALLGGNIAK